MDYYKEIEKIIDKHLKEKKCLHECWCRHIRAILSAYKSEMSNPLLNQTESQGINDSDADVSAG